MGHNRIPFVPVVVCLTDKMSWWAVLGVALQFLSPRLSEQARLEDPLSVKDGERDACQPWRGSPKTSKGYTAVSFVRGRIPHPPAGRGEATESQACLSDSETV